MIFNSYTLRLATIHVWATLALAVQIILGTSTDWLITSAVYCVVAINLTMTYHRHLAHKAFEFRWEWLRKLSILICTVGSGFSSPLAWVAIHREHHRKTDRLDDPHLGTSLRYLPKLHLTSMFIEPKLRYVTDLARDKYVMELHENYFVIHLAWMTILACISLAVYDWSSWWLIIPAYLTPLCLLWHTGNFVNSLSHLYGYRNFETADRSKNNPLVALLFFGEWHNNHHAHPNSARHGMRWWELDVTYWIIKLIGREKTS